MNDTVIAVDVAKNVYMAGSKFRAPIARPKIRLQSDLPAILDTQTASGKLSQKGLCLDEGVQIS